MRPEFVERKLQLIAEELGRLAGFRDLSHEDFLADAVRLAAIERMLEGLEPAFPGRNLDPVRLADADPLFRWEIMEPGLLLYGDPLDFLEYRAFAYRDFVDSADLRALERTLFEKRMAYVRGIVRGDALDGSSGGRFESSPATYAL